MNINLSFSVKFLNVKKELHNFDPLELNVLGIENILVSILAEIHVKEKNISVYFILNPYDKQLASCITRSLVAMP